MRMWTYSLDTRVTHIEYFPMHSHDFYALWWNLWTKFWQDVMQFRDDP